LQSKHIKSGSYISSKQLMIILTYACAGYRPYQGFSCPVSMGSEAAGSAQD
jgi:hypothetical protein